jgi:hypothetical protein
MLKRKSQTDVTHGESAGLASLTVHVKKWLHVHLSPSFRNAMFATCSRHIPASSSPV